MSLRFSFSFVVKKKSSMWIWLYRVVSKCLREQLLIAARIINMMGFVPSSFLRSPLSLTHLHLVGPFCFKVSLKCFVSLLFSFLELRLLLFWCVYTVFDLIQCARWMQKNEHAAYSHSHTLARSRLCWLIYIFMADSWTLVMFCSLNFVVFSLLAARTITLGSYSHTTNTTIVCVLTLDFSCHVYSHFTFLLGSMSLLAVVFSVLSFLNSEQQHNINVRASQPTNTYQMNDAWIYTAMKQNENDIF